MLVFNFIFFFEYIILILYLFKIILEFNPQMEFKVNNHLKRELRFQIYFYYLKLLLNNQDFLVEILMFILILILHEIEKQIYLLILYHNQEFYPKII